MKKLLVILLSFISINAAQICNENITKVTPNARFQNDDVHGLTKDLYTNLTWKRCPYGKTWNKDIKTCEGKSSLLTFQEGLKIANSTKGFRVANIKEILSLIENACSNPSLNISVFNNILNNEEEQNISKGYGYLFSSTVNVKNEFMYLDISNGHVLSTNNLEQKAVFLLVKEN